MARIFFTLALFAVLLLTTNALLGFFGGDYNGAMLELKQAAGDLDTVMRSPSSDRQQRDTARKKFDAVVRDSKPLRNWTTAHRLLGVAAALVTVLVNSITVTYFIGTSRWCREVVETYHLDMELADRSDLLKRGSFPWAAGSILLIIGLVALGAMSDPGANIQHSAQWVMPHYIMAITAIALITYSFMRQVVAIGSNYEVIEQILADVQQIRTDRGLS